MTRRQILQRIAVLLGGAISPPVVAAVLGDTRPAAAAKGWRPRTLTLDQDRLVTALAEIIIPATDTPGAAAAEVNRFIDLLLTDWFDEADRDRFLAGLAELESMSIATFERPFLSLDDDEQVSLLTPLDAAAVEARIAATSTRRERAVAELPFFGMLKEMTLVGYYTSEAGATQELRYDPYPGSFAGCVPLDGLGKTWASES